MAGWTKICEALWDTVWTFRSLLVAEMISAPITDERMERSTMPKWKGRNGLACRISWLFGIRNWNGVSMSTKAILLYTIRKTMAAAGIASQERDVVIWNGAQPEDYPCWLSGLKMAETIGATNAWSFDREAMCVAR